MLLVSDLFFFFFFGSFHFPFPEAGAFESMTYSDESPVNEGIDVFYVHDDPSTPFSKLCVISKTIAATI